MRRLTTNSWAGRRRWPPRRWLPRRWRQDADRGAAAVMIVVLLAGGVLLGMGALVVDVGQLYVERAELQNGADAAALAVAADAAGGSTANAQATAGSYANKNAKDNLSDAVAYLNTPAPSGAGTLVNCPSPAPTGNFVDVVTTTRTSAGTLLPPTFARALAGNDAYSGSTVRACARAQWGAPGGMNSLALTISFCEWENSQTSPYPLPPPYPPNPLPNPSVERVLVLHKSGSAPCRSTSSGANYPGGFGWLDDTDSTCRATVDTSHNYGGDTGANMSGPCETALNNAITTPTVVYLPVYDDSVSTVGGAHATYRLKGFAAFVPTGYYWSGGNERDSWLNTDKKKTAKKMCGDEGGGGAKCLFGYFTKKLVPAGELGTSPNLGLTIVQLTG